MQFFIKSLDTTKTNKNFKISNNSLLIHFDTNDFDRIPGKLTLRNTPNPNYSTSQKFAIFMIFLETDL